MCNKVQSIYLVEYGRTFTLKRVTMEKRSELLYPQLLTKAYKSSSLLGMDVLKKIKHPDDEITPLLYCAWNHMSERFKNIVLSEDPIISITSKASKIAATDRGFIRSDIGQVIGILPDYEVYYGPTVGKIALRELVAEFWSTFYKLDHLTYENVAVTTGATEALFLLFSIFGYGRKVILMSPHWPTFPDTIRKAGSDYVRFELVDEDGVFRIDELESLIKSTHINVMLVNSPNNPSGIALERQNMEQLAELAERYNMIIISDEVYNRIRYRGEPDTMLRYAPDRTVVVTSASKEYLIPGLRVGFVISKSKTLTDVIIKKLLRCQSSCPNTAGQDVVMEIMKREVDELKGNKEPSFITPIVEELKNRRDAIADALTEVGFKVFGNRPPDGTIFTFAKIPETVNLSDKEFIGKAMDLHLFSAIPGSACGKPGWLRFSFGNLSLEDISQLKNNLQKFLNIIGR